MIAEDRHIDILEMDAASHTGVGDIRELIDTVRYLPTSARYKIYIIDEVHMLSNSAFNALLKTLEEPPPHVKFIFATTEARKIPVTILSRCQRFDLKRIELEMLSTHLGNIAAKEHIGAEPEALTLIAVAAEGSVRDALSLLDQAIARTEAIDGKTVVTAAAVRAMIGSADKTATFRLIEKLLSGEPAAALEEVQAQYHAGSDPLLMVQDALEATHLITRVKVSAAALADVSLSENDRTMAKALSGQLSMPILTRLWQMLLKGITEVRMAPQPLAALEMLIVRIAYAAQLPTPAEAIKSGVESAPAKPPLIPPPVQQTAQSTPAQMAPSASEKKISVSNSAPQAAIINSFEDVAALLDQHREGLKHAYLTHDCYLIHFAPGEITLRMAATLPRDFPNQIAAFLTEHTAQPWKVILSEEQGSPSLHEQAQARKEQHMQQAAEHPLVGSVLEQFPGAKLLSVN